MARFEHHGAGGGRFGAKHLVEVLAGASTQRIKQYGHDGLSTYALLAELPRDTIDAFVNQLVDQGALARAEGDRPVIHLTEASREFLEGKRPVRLIEPATAPKASRRDTASWEGVDRELFERLRTLRGRIAQERGVPPYVVFSDNTLRDMARLRPSRKGLLLSISGVGARKLEEYGDVFADAICEYCESAGVETDVRLTDNRTRSTGSGEAPPRPRPSNVTKEVRKLLSEGASLERIAQCAGLTTGTIAKKLADLIEEGGIEDVSAWVDAETYARADAAFAELGDERLKPVRDHLNEDVSYDTLHIVRAARRLQS